MPTDSSPRRFALHERLTCACLLLPLVLAGCNGNLYFNDDEGAPRPGSSALSEHPDQLSLPYALGTTVNIAVTGDDQAKVLIWTIQSDNPSVLKVNQLSTQSQVLSALCTATGEGTAHLRLLDNQGQERRRAQVSVKAPNSARLLAHGRLRVLGMDTAALPGAQVPSATLLTGSTSVFAVTYYNGPDRVYGRGIATTALLPQLTVKNSTASGLVVNEFLSITPQADGPYPLEVSADGRMLLSVPLVSVPDTAIASLAMLEEIKPKTEDKQQVWVLAQARDSTLGDIYGAYSAWALAGVPQIGQNSNTMQTSGDLFRYEYDPKATPQGLAATHGAQRAAIQIMAHDGWVADTTYLGCSAAPGHTGAGGTTAIIPTALLLAALRGRRLRRASTVR